jgi:hypothetical protein
MSRRRIKSKVSARSEIHRELGRQTLSGWVRRGIARWGLQDSAEGFNPGIGVWIFSRLRRDQQIASFYES